MPNPQPGGMRVPPALERVAMQELKQQTSDTLPMVIVAGTALLVVLFFAWVASGTPIPWEG